MFIIIIIIIIVIYFSLFQNQMQEFGKEQR